MSPRPSLPTLKLKPPGPPGAAALEPADRAEPADLVVLLALGFVAQHVVGRADFLEPLLGSVVAGVGVGMAAAGQLAIRLGDVFRRRRRR